MTVLIPTTIDAAFAALADHPDAVVLAGGTDLMVEVNAGHRALEWVVAIDRIPELRVWRHDAAAKRVRIGAGVPYASLMRPPLCDLLPALAQASRTVGSPQIRHVGTLGGNLGTCSPAGDGLPVLSALDAIVHVAGADGMRDVSVHDFVVGVKRNALRTGELITAVSLPVLDGWQGYAKVGVRNAMVIAVASSALAVDLAGRSVRVALGSVGPVIIRCREAEAWVADRVDWADGLVDDAVISEFGERCASEARPIDDHRSTAAYRRHAIGVLTRRQLRRAFPDRQDDHG